MNIVCNYDVLKEKLLTYGCPLDRIDEELNSLKRSGNLAKEDIIQIVTPYLENCACLGRDSHQGNYIERCAKGIAEIINRRINKE